MTDTLPKSFAQKWIDAARKALIQEGHAGIKVDRLAANLGVTRGGFYHNFSDRDDLLVRLLHDWEDRCQFLPKSGPGSTPQEAVLWFDKLSDRIVTEVGYDRDFDMAVREWGRSDQRAAWAIERADAKRISGLKQFFLALGYADDEALTRAQIFYFHQIGYYAIGIRQTVSERRRSAKLYIDILCGVDCIAAGRANLAYSEQTQRPPAKRASTRRPKLGSA